MKERSDLPDEALKQKTPNGAQKSQSFYQKCFAVVFTILRALELYRLFLNSFGSQLPNRSFVQQLLHEDAGINATLRRKGALFFDQAIGEHLHADCSARPIRHDEVGVFRCNPAFRA